MLPLHHAQKLWRSQGVTIPFFMRDRHTCVHEHFETKFGGATWSRTKNVYHEGTDLQSADAHAIASIAPYLVDRRGIEPRPEACKATVLPLSLSAQILASREGLEPPRTVLETVMLPLHHPDKLNTLFPMCVLKHTRSPILLTLHGICFNTLGFFYVQEHKPSPRPPICSLE